MDGDTYFTDVDEGTYTINDVPVGDHTFEAIKLLTPMVPVTDMPAKHSIFQQAPIRSTLSPNRKPVLSK